MTIQEQIRVKMALRDMNYSDIARKIDRTPQAVATTVRKGTMTIATLTRIADALGCDVEITLKDRA